MSIDKKEALDKFDNFLMVMDDQNESLEQEALKLDIELTYSIDSIDKLESLFNLMAEDADKETIDGLIVSFARYLGEIVCKNLDGKWVLSLNDPKSINYNMPVIVGHAQEGLEFSPISTMRAFSIRKKPGFLKQAVYADIEVNPVDLSDLIED